MDEVKKKYRRYVTTRGDRWQTDDPEPPDATADWKMVGAAATGDFLYWFWLLEWEDSNG